jgi:hypothetical protein
MVFSKNIIYVNKVGGLWLTWRRKMSNISLQEMLLQSNNLGLQNRLEDNIKTYLMEMACDDGNWTELIHENVPSHVLLLVVLNFLVLALVTEISPNKQSFRRWSTKKHSGCNTLNFISKVLMQNKHVIHVCKPHETISSTFFKCGEYTPDINCNTLK